MNLAEPATPVAPATADAAPVILSVNNDAEYFVEPAEEAQPTNATAAPKVEPAELYSDARKFAPNDQLDESYAKNSINITPKELSKNGATFAGTAAISRGLKMTLGRRCLPFLFDPREFISYGEAARYVVLKDQNCFVFIEESATSPLYNIPLGSLQPVKEDPKKPHKRSVTFSPSVHTNLSSADHETVLLLDARGELAYQFTFDISQHKDLATRFICAVLNINAYDKTIDKGQAAVPSSKKLAS